MINVVGQVLLIGPGLNIFIRFKIYEIFMAIVNVFADMYMSVNVMNLLHIPTLVINLLHIPACTNLHKVPVCNDGPGLALAGAYTSECLEVFTSRRPNVQIPTRSGVQTLRHPHVWTSTSTRLEVYMPGLLYFQAFRRLNVWMLLRLCVHTSALPSVYTSIHPGVCTSYVQVSRHLYACEYKCLDVYTPVCLYVQASVRLNTCMSKHLYA